MTAEQLATARPFAEALPHLAETLRRRGPVKKKEAVSIRLDFEIVQKPRETGSGWQSRVNELLRDYVAKADRKKSSRKGA